MKHRGRIVAALAAGALLSGCAASRPEARKEDPAGLSVRLPITDAPTMAIESDPSFAKPDLPLSQADETRDRWLNMFEVNYTPAKPPLPDLPPLPVSEEVPSR